MKTTTIKDTSKYLGGVWGTFPHENASFIKAELGHIAVGQTVYTYMSYGAYRRSKVKAIATDGTIILDCADPINPQSKVYPVVFSELYVKAE